MSVNFNISAGVEEKTPALAGAPGWVEELPYFAESFPGKVCCLCNLGERSALGQGAMLQLNVPPVPFDINLRKDRTDADRLKSDGTDQSLYRKLKNSSKHKAISTGETNYELDKIGHTEILDDATLQDGGYIYIHRMCAMWSLQKSQVAIADVPHFLTLLSEFLEQKCCFCGQYGASIKCKMNCRQVHHWPCAAAAGCLLILESFTVFCTEHLSQVLLICSDNNVECLTCSSLGDLSKLVMCSTCGDHFHSNCIGLTNLPDTRSGWNCARCTKCQICRQQDSNDVKFVKCEQCQKIYHASCLRPVLSSIPKYGWKCNRCRVCTDCGSRTPGGGSSSRWHSHYTICDSCYQQRNKGFSCPICQKAYRAAAYKEMVKCSSCHKFVHSTCDEEADLAAYHKKKESNPDYDYVCPLCKAHPPTESPAIESVDFAPGESQTSELPSTKDVELNPLEAKPTAEMPNEDAQKQPNNKRKVCMGNVRGKGGKVVLQRMSVMSQMGKKRSTRGKGRQLVLPSSSGERYVNRSLDTDIASDRKMLLCSARDKFILTQDICVMCGSLGIESDSAMITCAQCGQCYHPYCAGVKPSKGMLQKGWRCLDCTVCEGCGKKNDEARLLLCDECDISYHIYCVNPPLDTVPQGNWKCSYCTICQKCGRNPTEKSDYSDMSLVECCPPCNSQTVCSVCANAYNNGEMLIQCEQCEHWSHFLCDSINAQLTIDYYNENTYNCFKCRGNANLSNAVEKGRNEDALALQKPLSQVGQEGKTANATDRNIMFSNEFLESSEAIHWIDGVCLSESGLNMIKALSTEIKRKRKMRQPLGNSMLDSGLAEEVPCDKYKDGMIWDATETTLPEGFTISTNEEGVNILRKKRQRNLQKLGIGGFSVRNRTLKKDNEETPDQLNAILAIDKKKKIIRKKQKNKLIEAYPAYLQEAFFGKTLLESGETVAYESDSSDEIDMTMRIYFTSSDGKTSDDNLTLSQALKDSAKSVKKVKTEKAFPENKNTFMEQFSVSTQQKETSIPETSNNFATIDRHSLESSTTRSISELDGPNLTVNFGAPAENLEKVMSKPPVVMMENYNTPQQVPQEQKFSHSQLYLSVNMAPNSTQLHYQHQQQQQDLLNMPNKLKAQPPISAQVGMPGEKRVDDDPKANEPAAEGMNVGTQKTAEKMRKDEDLGLMATISAVLYANTEHANLKELYPNWNDRCKQILKRWRSLCNEKKAPFLQKAKDNRSALRQRREQSKITLPPKLQKQEDTVRGWKHHQVKLKEDQSNSNMFVSFNGIAYDPPCYVGPVPHTPNHVPLIVNESFVNKSSVQRTLGNGSESSAPLKMEAPENPMNLNASYGSEDIGDKKLRNLLQKQNSEPMLMAPNSELFMQNDVLRLGLVSNASLAQNNPMLSISGKPQQSELRQNIQELEQDAKNQPDLKITESQEGISSAVELENVGFSDILGGLGEGDDDDLLKSLTSEIGDDFNILEYADPELDVNVLNTLDFEDNEKGSS